MVDMNRNQNRLTLVVTGPTALDREWTSAVDTTRLVFLDSVHSAEEMISVGEIDIERVVLESGSASATEFLILLASVGSEFQGDMLLIGLDGGGFLSAVGRGGERVLYAPTRNDVDFYLSTLRLAEPAEYDATVLPFAEISRLALWVA